MDNNGLDHEKFTPVSENTESIFENADQRNDYMNYALRQSNGAGWDNASLNSFRGFRAFPYGPSGMPVSNNTIGLMFITRPSLNLSDSNIYLSDKLVNLAGANSSNIQGFIRGTLDPDWGATINHPMLDPNNPFIPILSEYVKTSDGFGDISLDFENTEPGIRKQIYQNVAGFLEENGTYTIQQTYFNPHPNVIPALFQTWLRYVSEVVTGDNQLDPKYEYLLKHRNDHDCRIYHLEMNKDSNYLESIYMSVQSIPENYPVGSRSAIDRTANGIRAKNQDEFSMQFRSVGMRFDELGCIKAFNEHTFLRIPALYEQVIHGKGSLFRELNNTELLTYSYQMYPLLLLKENEVIEFKNQTYYRSGIKLTWWIYTGGNNGN